MNMSNSSLLIGIIVNSLALIIGGFRIYLNIARKLDRINYALFNDGVHGVVQQVADLHENQQVIKTDIEVMKTKLNK